MDIRESRFLYIYNVGKQKPKTHHELISDLFCNNIRRIILRISKSGGLVYRVTYLFIHEYPDAG